MHEVIQIQPEVHLYLFFTWNNSHSLNLKNKLEEESEKYGGEEFFHYVDCDKEENQYLIQENKVGYIPTVIILKNGKEFVRSFHGVSPDQCFKLFIQAFNS